MFTNISLKKKLTGLLAVPLLVFIVISVYLIEQSKSDLTHMENVLYQITDQATSLILNADRDMYQGLTAYQLLASGTLDAEQRTKQIKDLNDNIGQANERVGKAAVILADNHLLQLIHTKSKLTPQKNLDMFKEFYGKWATQVLGNIKTTDKASEIFNDKLMTDFGNARQGLNEIGEDLDVYAGEQTDLIKTDNQKLQTWIYIVISILVVAIAVTGYLIIRQITKTITQILRKTERVSQGDLQMDQHPTYDKDELGFISQSVDTMTKKLRDLLQEISISSQQVNISSEELNLSSKESAIAANSVARDIEEVTLGVEMQARSSEETSKAMLEMATGIQKIAAATSVVAEFSSNTEVNAEKGNQLLGKMKIQMSYILTSIQFLAGIIKSLNESSEKIGQIVDNINIFAKSTNLLSLNASIEAARAGEHGKGFTVVANEIRKLAAQSTDSAEVISDLIEETRREIKQASNYMEKSENEVIEGHSIMEEVNIAFDKILSAVMSMSHEIHETSAITEQMSASSEQVSAMMGESASTSKETFGKTESVAAATEEQLAVIQTIAHSADQMTQVVSNLNRSIAYFKL
jgi:methyl-accepting chemotaxis protein